MKDKTLDRIALGIVWGTAALLGVLTVMNWQFMILFFLPLLAMVLLLGWVIGWAVIRCYRIYRENESPDKRLERALKTAAKATVITAAGLAVVTPAKAITTSNIYQASAYGVYAHFMSQWAIFYNNFITQ